MPNERGVSGGGGAVIKRLRTDCDLSVASLQNAWAAQYRETGQPPTVLHVSPEAYPYDPTLLFFIEKHFKLRINVRTAYDTDWWSVGDEENNGWGSHAWR